MSIEMAATDRRELSPEVNLGKRSSGPSFWNTENIILLLSTITSLAITVLIGILGVQAITAAHRQLADGGLIVTEYAFGVPIGARSLTTGDLASLYIRIGLSGVISAIIFFSQVVILVKRIRDT